MAKRKALSVTEKRCKLLELFHESSDVFQLKDLERLAPKEKGIVQQSVKTTLQELIDEGQVRSEKISGSTYFWSFPGEALHANKRLLDQSETLDIELSNKIEKAQRSLETAMASQSNVADAAAMKDEMEVLRKEKKELEQSLAAVQSDIDYDDIIAKERDTKKILEAANRWTDNIFSIKTWCKRKFDKEDKELDKAFGIPEDLDYLKDT